MINFFKTKIIKGFYKPAKTITVLILIFSVSQATAMDSYDIFKKWKRSLIDGSKSSCKNNMLSGVAWEYRKEIRNLSGEELANLLFLIDLAFPNISYAADTSEAYGAIVATAKRENVVIAQKLLTSISYKHMEAVYGYNTDKYKEFISHYSHLVELHDYLNKKQAAKKQI